MGKDPAKGREDDWVDAFELLSKKKKVKPDDAIMLMRALGINMTTADFHKAIGPKDIEFKKFEELMRQFKVDQNLNGAMDAFAAFDAPDTGYIRANDLKAILMHGGDALTAAEVDKFLQMAHVDKDGMVEYGEAVKQMHNQAESVRQR